MFGLSLSHILIVGLVVAVLFGAKKLPEMAKSLGEGLREFKKATHADPEIK
jgi:sec-independent protein translocase protein TatA